MYNVMLHETNVTLHETKEEIQQMGGPARLQGSVAQASSCPSHRLVTWGHLFLRANEILRGRSTARALHHVAAGKVRPGTFKMLREQSSPDQH